MQDYTNILLDRGNWFLFPIWKAGYLLAERGPKPPPPSINENFIYENQTYKTTSVKVSENDWPIPAGIAIWLEVKAERVL